MVIGNGMVAKSFAHYLERQDVVVFASGVSNSKLAIASEFQREKNLLQKALDENKGKKIIYFSTFNLYDPIEKNSAYCLHKLDMEEFLSINAPLYNIFRLGHVAGRSAKQYTILSFLSNAIEDGTSFKLWKHASRNIIDIDDINKICSYIIDNDLYLNQITNICNNKNTTIVEIVDILEAMLNKKGNYSVFEEGGCPDVDNTKIRLIATDLGVNFNDSYVKDVIVKYYYKNKLDF
jgi:nucleoside-diphosphate-sugar epimerase